MVNSDRIKSILPLLIFLVVSVFPYFVQAQNQGKPNINCFVYHRFGEEELPSTNISIKIFKQQLQYLHDHDYTVLTMGEAVERMKSSKNLPEKTAVLTVDDGYKSFKTAAVPLLNQYNYKATIFICTQYVGKSGYLSWDDIRKLREEGHEFGNHSHSHEHFLNYSDGDTKKAFIEDLNQSEEIFLRQLGDKPELYCYPYGEYNPDMQKILKERGYNAAAAQKSGVFYTGSDLFAIPRFPMTSSYGEIGRFQSKAGMKALPVVKEIPANPEIKDTNPPRLTLHVDNGNINPDNIQCFVNGRRSCKITSEEGSQLILNVSASEPLRTRRTLYTITAPSKSGAQWYWYTHLWVNTQYGE
jgi:peptidoglycan/xylan/chitin deacetylase (PgdA/CDA1 family)